MRILAENHKSKASVLTGTEEACQVDETGNPLIHHLGEMGMPLGQAAMLATEARMDRPAGLPLLLQPSSVVWRQ